MSINTVEAGKIVLRIAGTKARKGGFAPLVSIGVLPGDEGNNMDRITLGGEKPDYAIKHADGYILYSLIDRKVKSFDADAAGVLSIALTISRGYRLCGNKSPYTLLRQIYDTFRTLYMSVVSDGRDEFKDVDVDDTVFREILSEYQLESFNGPYIKMIGKGLSGQLRVDEDKMEDLFRDSQYREFENFEDIEIGLRCQTTPQLDSIQIPRPMRYTLIIYETPGSGRIISSLDEQISVSKEASSSYEYTPTEFTLREVFAAGGTLRKDGAIITVNYEREQIDCKLKKSEILYDIKLYYDCEDYIKREVEKAIGQKVRLYLKGKDISTANKVSIADVKDKVEIRPTELNDSYKLSVSTSYSIDDTREFVVKIKAENKPKPAPQKPTGYYPVGQHSSNTPRQTSGREDDDYESTFSSPSLEEKERMKRDKMRKRILFTFAVFVLGLLIGIFGTLAVLHNHLTSKPKEQPVLEEQTNVDNQSVVASDVVVANPVVEPVEPEKTIPEVNQELERAKNAQKEIDRAEILELVNKKNYKDCENHPAWKTALTEKERIAISAILKPSQYEDQVNGVGKKLLSKISDSIKTCTINNWNDITDIQMRIIKITNNNKKTKK